jgi:hypothetical protein
MRPPEIGVRPITETVEREVPIGLFIRTRRTVVRIEPLRWRSRPRRGPLVIGSTTIRGMRVIEVGPIYAMRFPRVYPALFAGAWKIPPRRRSRSR